jgi:hypothetical protein
VDARAIQRTGTGRALGNGHVLIESAPAPGGRPIASWTPHFGEEKKAAIEALQRQFEARGAPCLTAWSASAGVKRNS